MNYLLLFQTIATYNAALVNNLGIAAFGPDAILPTRTERRDAIIHELLNTCADLLCLQEVSLTIHLSDIIFLSMNGDYIIF